jgi:single-strand DNA-binding protein
MANLNRVFLIGNLTRDVELRVTPKGTAIGQFGLAINRQYKAESGELRDDVTFVDIEAWGKQAETLAKYVTKGKPLFVEGRLRFDQWTDTASGQKRSKLKVVLESFQFLGSRGESAEGTQHRNEDARQPAGHAQASSKPAQTENQDEDIPF